MLTEDGVKIPRYETGAGEAPAAKSSYQEIGYAIVYVQRG